MVNLSANSSSAVPDPQKDYEKFIFYLTESPDEKQALTYLNYFRTRYDNAAFLQIDNHISRKALTISVTERNEVLVQKKYPLLTLNSLCVAVQCGYYEVVSALINMGVNIEVTSHSPAPALEGLTPLFIALIYRNRPIVELLLENGANILHTNKIGQTCLDIPLHASRDIREYVKEVAERRNCLPTLENLHKQYLILSRKRHRILRDACLSGDINTFQKVINEIVPLHANRQLSFRKLLCYTRLNALEKPEDQNLEAMCRELKTLLVHSYPAFDFEKNSLSHTVEQSYQEIFNTKYPHGVPKTKEATIKKIISQFDVLMDAKNSIPHLEFLNALLKEFMLAKGYPLPNPDPNSYKIFYIDGYPFPFPLISNPSKHRALPQLLILIFEFCNVLNNVAFKWYGYIPPEEIANGMLKKTFLVVDKGEGVTLLHGRYVHSLQGAEFCLEHLKTGLPLFYQHNRVKIPIRLRDVQKGLVNLKNKNDELTWYNVRDAPNTHVSFANPFYTNTFFTDAAKKYDMDVLASYIRDVNGKMSQKNINVYNELYPQHPLTPDQYISKFQDIELANLETDTPWLDDSLSKLEKKGIPDLIGDFHTLKYAAPRVYREFMGNKIACNATYFRSAVDILLKHHIIRSNEIVHDPNKIEAKHKKIGLLILLVRLRGEKPLNTMLSIGFNLRYFIHSFSYDEFRALLQIRFEDAHVEKFFMEKHSVFDRKNLIRNLNGRVDNLELLILNQNKLWKAHWPSSQTIQLLKMESLETLIEYLSRIEEHAKQLLTAPVRPQTWQLPQLQLHNKRQKLNHPPQTSAPSTPLFSRTAKRPKPE